MSPDPGIYGSRPARPPIRFVPANSTPEATNEVQSTPKSRIVDKYLSIVLGKAHSVTLQGDEGTVIDNHSKGDIDELCQEAGNGTQKASQSSSEAQVQVQDYAKEAEAGSLKTCETCRLPLHDDSSNAKSSTHDLLLAHQVCTTHSHPPSHLDRRRLGLKYLSSHGWDPDSRQGLGTRGEGIKAPIRVNVKNDTMGLGAVVPNSRIKPKSIGRLDAGKIRKLDKQERQRAVKLHDMFYQSDEIQKYLGQAGN